MILDAVLRLSVEHFGDVSPLGTLLVVFFKNEPLVIGSYGSPLYVGVEVIVVPFSNLLSRPALDLVDFLHLLRDNGPLARVLLHQLQNGAVFLQKGVS